MIISIIIDTKQNSPTKDIIELIALSILYELIWEKYREISNIIIRTE